MYRMCTSGGRSTYRSVARGERARLGQIELADMAWQTNHIPLNISTNAGHFLCDYIYFNSLAQCFKANETRRVAFLHVPAAKPEPDYLYEEHIKVGREIATQLIRSVVESELSRASVVA